MDNHKTTNLQDIAYQDEVAANAKTKIDIRSGDIRGGFGYWGILPTVNAMISLPFMISKSSIIPKLMGVLGANENITLYFSKKDNDGNYILGSAVMSAGKPVSVDSSTNYGYDDLDDINPYFFVKTVTATPVGLILIPNSAMRNICKDLYL